MLCHLRGLHHAFSVLACGWGNLARDSGTGWGQGAGGGSLVVSAKPPAFPEHCSEGGPGNSEMDTVLSLPWR